MAVPIPPPKRISSSVKLLGESVTNWIWRDVTYRQSIRNLLGGMTYGLIHYCLRVTSPAKEYTVP